MSKERKRAIPPPPPWKLASPEEWDGIEAKLGIYNPPSKAEVAAADEILKDQIKAHKISPTQNQPTKQQSNAESEKDKVIQKIIQYEFILESNTRAPGDSHDLETIHNSANFGKFSTKKWSRILQAEANRESPQRKKWGKYKNLTREQFAQQVSRYLNKKGPIDNNPEIDRIILANWAFIAAEDEEFRKHNKIQKP